MKYTTSEALTYAEEGKIESWVLSFLNNEGDNKAFAEGLQLVERFYTDPIMVPLKSFNRICGPEPKMEFVVDKESFNSKVEKIQKRMLAGWDMPPLIINFTSGLFILNDGNHRYEALIRRGKKTHYAIFWSSNHEDANNLKRLINRGELNEL